MTHKSLRNPLPLPEFFKLGKQLHRSNNNRPTANRTHLQQLACISKQSASAELRIYVISKCCIVARLRHVKILYTGVKRNFCKGIKFGEYILL